MFKVFADHVASDVLKKNNCSTWAQRETPNNIGGIGVVIKMNDGSKHWFFEDEVS